MAESGMAQPAPEGKVPILESVRAGYAFMAENLRRVVPAAMLIAAPIAVMLTLATTTAPLTTLSLLLASAALMQIYTAFLLRWAIRKDDAGFYGLRFGQDEANILGSFAVVTFFFFIVGIVCFVVLVATIGVAAVRAGVDPEGLQGAGPEAAAAMLRSVVAGPDAPLIAVVVGAILALVLWLLARLILWSAATIGEGRIMVFATWDWTRGNALRVVATILLTFLPLYLAISVVAGIFISILGLQSGAGGEIAGPIWAVAAFQFASALGQLLFLTPAMVGLTTHLYIGLRPPELAAPQPQS